MSGGFQWNFSGVLTVEDVATYLNENRKIYTIIYMASRLGRDMKLQYNPA